MGFLHQPLRFRLPSPSTSETLVARLIDRAILDGSTFQIYQGVFRILLDQLDTRTVCCCAFNAQHLSTMHVFLPQQSELTAVLGQYADVGMNFVSGAPLNERNRVEVLIDDQGLYRETQVRQARVVSCGTNVYCGFQVKKRPQLINSCVIYEITTPPCSVARVTLVL